jgi:hypothetical protein
LSQPEQLVHFVRSVIAGLVVSKECLVSAPTNQSRHARDHKISIERRKGVCKVLQRGLLLPALRRIEKWKAFGAYLILKSMEQVRYDLRKLKGHGMLQRGRRYAYRRDAKGVGVNVALLFLFVLKRLCGPLANSRFITNTTRPTSRTANSSHLLQS